MKKSSLKQAIKTHWEDETCGVRYGTSRDRASFFAEIEQARYKLEPHILEFADFPSGKGKKVLEIGVGAGSDFCNWVRHGAEATGIDLTEASIKLTEEHLQHYNLQPTTYNLLTADAEHLPFPDNSFDIVYSWGVLHHTPDTARALRECCRVLRPNGILKVMIYHLPSWTGWMMWTNSLLRRKKFYLTSREAVFENLESPGTKAYTLKEAHALLDGIGFKNIRLETKLSAGDLLNIEPSKKYQSRLDRLLWKFYPRWLVRAFGDRLGLELLIKAEKLDSTTYNLQPTTYNLMCGITGIFHFQNQNTVNSEILARMRDTLLHRGPDDEGIYISKNQKLGFGFRRLSIIDLSPTGHQPMTSACSSESIWTMFNGEIYNFQNLRRELETKDHTFHSKSDTEVILHSYEERGLEAVQDWNGMFAVALWDEKHERLWLVRDRLGIKPLYYTIQNGTLIFASEIKAILEYPGVKRKLNREALFHYLTFACCPAPMTLFEGIKKLPAGFYLTVDEKGVKEIQYWDAMPKIPRTKNQEHKNNPNSKFQIPITEEYFIENIRGLLKDSVERQMVCDVPFGVFLSGGIDSSTNVSLMTSARGKPVDSFSVNVRGFPRYDEFQWARKVAEAFKSNHHEITVGQQDLIDFLPELAFHADDPNGDPVCFPLYYVSKLIRDSGVIVAQVGEGADELFAGYNQYLLVTNFWKRWWRKLERLPSPLKKLIFELGKLTSHPAYDLHREQLRRLAAAEEFFWGGAIAFTEFSKWNLLSKNFRENLEGISSFQIVQPHYEKIGREAPETDFLNRMIYLELKIRLSELLLMRVDKITMANSIESRVPFLDHRLVELAMRIPMDLKLKNGVSKYILKEAVRGITPDAVIDRKKQGFAAPVTEWLRKGKIADQLIQTLWKSKMWEEDIFDRAAVEKLIAAHQNGKVDASFRIWNLITLGLWFDRWL